MKGQYLNVVRCTKKRDIYGAVQLVPFRQCEFDVHQQKSRWRSDMNMQELCPCFEEKEASLVSLGGRRRKRMVDLK